MFLGVTRIKKFNLKLTFTWKSAASFFCVYFPAFIFLRPLFWVHFSCPFLLLFFLCNFLCPHPRVHVSSSIFLIQFYQSSFPILLFLPNFLHILFLVLVFSSTFHYLLFFVNLSSSNFHRLFFLDQFSTSICSRKFLLTQFALSIFPRSFLFVFTIIFFSFYRKRFIIYGTVMSQNIVRLGLLQTLKKEMEKGKGSGLKILFFILLACW